MHTAVEITPSNIVLDKVLIIIIVVIVTIKNILWGNHYVPAIIWHVYVWAKCPYIISCNTRHRCTRQVLRKVRHHSAIMTLAQSITANQLQSQGAHSHSCVLKPSHGAL